MEPMPERRLRACAETNETGSQASGRIPLPALAYGAANPVRKAFLRGEQRKIGPVAYEVFDSPAQNALCQGCVRSMPGDAFGLGIETRRGAFKNQTSHSFRPLDGGSKGDPSSHRIADPRRPLSFEKIENRN